MMLTPCQREVYTARIIAGKLRFTYLKKQYIITKPTRELLYEASELYHDLLLDYERSGLLTEGELKVYLNKHGLWTEVDEGLLKQTTTDIEEIKVKMYETVFRSNDVKELRKLLANANDKYISLGNRKFAYHYLTAAGAAFLSKVRFILGFSLIKDNKPAFTSPKAFWSYRGMLVDKAIEVSNTNKLSDQTIRVLSRSDPWRSYWLARQSENSVFGYPVVDLSDDQRALVLWSRTYDNIREHPDCPPEVVFDDDDMMDGWMITQRRKKDIEIKKARAEGMITNEKIRGSDEVYIVAQTKEDRELVDSLNDPVAAAIKKQRLDYIRKHGVVNEVDMPDTKFKLAMLKNQLAAQAIRNT